jgi:DNA-binding transcriptional LysR family regulator
MVMELRHIRYFLAVAEERHFTRAAAKVGIGQPPLSQQIKDLEVEIGAALFRRVAHGAELTPAGLAFLERVKGMPALAEQGKQAARRASRGELGSLRVGFTASSAFNAVVPTAIRSAVPMAMSSSRLRKATQRGSSRALRRDRSMPRSCTSPTPGSRPCNSDFSPRNRWVRRCPPATLSPRGKLSILQL